MDDFVYNADASVFATIGGMDGPDYAEMNKGIRFAFETKWEALDKTDADGNPIGHYFDVVHIIVPGDSLNVSTQPMDQANKERFAKEYAEWKRTKAEKIEGLPIREWPVLTAAHARVFEAAGYKTVEEIARSADETIRRAIPDGLIWKAKAAAYLTQNKDAKHAAKLAADNARLQTQVENLTLRIEEMSTALKSMQADKPKAA